LDTVCTVTILNIIPFLQSIFKNKNKPPPSQKKERERNNQL
jgi:hypothetical protein